MKTNQNSKRPCRRIFYVTYSSDDNRQRVLDAIRFLADPSEKSRAHVTVRGPYQRKQKVSAADKTVVGSEIRITGVDVFLRPGQNTVFFAVAAPSLKSAWHKPDYPGYKPHLTIYDGNSREFADRLYSKLKEINPTFTLSASPLVALATVKGQNSLELRAAYSEDLVNKLTGRRISPDEVADLPAEERIDLIAELCGELVAHKSGSIESVSTAR